MVRLSLALLLVSFGCASTQAVPPRVDPPPPGSAADAPAQDDLPPGAHAILRERMQRHRDMSELLMSSALRLQYPEVEVAAGEILAEPQLARPTGDDADTLNARVPPRFFALQDDLMAAARAARDAARAKDGEKLATAYGQLATSCVRCHAAYVHTP